jgi:hypothetical protein
MTRPFLDLLVLLLVAGASLGAFLTRRAQVRLLPVLVATIVWGAVAALVLVGEVLRLTLIAGPAAAPSRAWLPTAAAAVGMLPTAVVLARVGLRAARAPAAAKTARSRP